MLAIQRLLLLQQIILDLLGLIAIPFDFAEE
jgi:hypothetical protein